MDIYLRALEIDDYKLMHKWRANEKIKSHLAGNVFFVSSEREKQSIENKIFDDKTDLYLAICKKDDDQMIGYCSINKIDLRNLKAEWGGTLISPDYIGKGYGFKSAKLMLRFLFDQYPIHKCNTSCLESHSGTIKLFEKLGFKKDGVLRDEVFKDGSFKNIALYSLLREEINKNF